MRDTPNVVRLRTESRPLGTRKRTASPAVTPAAPTTTCTLPDEARAGFDDLSTEVGRMQSTFTGSFTTTTKRGQAIAALRKVEAAASRTRKALERAERRGNHHG